MDSSDLISVASGDATASRSPAPSAVCDSAKPSSIPQHPHLRPAEKGRVISPLPDGEISSLKATTEAAVRAEHVERMGVLWILALLVGALMVLIIAFPLITVISAAITSDDQRFATISSNNTEMFRAVLPFASAMIGYLAREFVARLRKS